MSSRLSPSKASYSALVLSALPFLLLPPSNPNSNINSPQLNSKHARLSPIKFSSFVGVEEGQHRLSDFSPARRRSSTSNSSLSLTSYLLSQPSQRPSRLPLLDDPPFGTHPLHPHSLWTPNTIELVKRHRLCVVDELSRPPSRLGRSRFVKPSQSSSRLQTLGR